jgi:hypothetical protein
MEGRGKERGDVGRGEELGENGGRSGGKSEGRSEGKRRGGGGRREGKWMK